MAKRRKFERDFWAEGRSFAFQGIWSAVGAFVMWIWGLQSDLAGPVVFSLGLLSGYVVFRILSIPQERQQAARQQEATDKLIERADMLAGIPPSQDSVLEAIAEAERVARAAQEAFWESAVRRERERDPNWDDSATKADTFEGAARDHLPEWRARFDDARIKLVACGVPVHVEDRPVQQIQGEPTAEHLKFLAELEALEAARQRLN